MKFKNILKTSALLMPLCFFSLNTFANDQTLEESMDQVALDLGIDPNPQTKTPPVHVPLPLDEVYCYEDWAGQDPEQPAVGKRSSCITKDGTVYALLESDPNYEVLKKEHMLNNGQCNNKLQKCAIEAPLGQGMPGFKSKGIRTTIYDGIQVKCKMNADNSRCESSDLFSPSYARKVDVNEEQRIIGSSRETASDPAQQSNTSSEINNQ